MVSKLIVAGMLFGAVFAEVDLKSEHFEKAICKESYKSHEVSDKELKLDTLITTHGCHEKKPDLCLVTNGDGLKYLTCAEKKKEFEEANITFKVDDKFTIHEKTVEKVTHIECKEATNKYDSKFKEALLAMDGKKKDFKDLVEVKEDTHSYCIVVIEEEEKKDGDKKEGNGDKKEIKKISQVYWFTVNKKDHKTTEKVEKVTIMGKEYKGIFCGTKADVEKEAKAFETAGESSGCCSCAWYVWVIIAVVIVGAAGAGAYVIFKADEDEDEFANEYSA